METEKTAENGYFKVDDFFTVREGGKKLVLRELLECEEVTVFRSDLSEGLCFGDVVLDAIILDGDEFQIFRIYFDSHFQNI